MAYPADEIARLQREIQRLTLLLNQTMRRLSDVWPPRPKRRDLLNGQTIELVVVTGDVASDGDETTAPVITYSFTTAAGVSFSGKTIENLRSKGTFFAAGIAWWVTYADGSTKLVSIDEVRDTGTCSDSPAVLRSTPVKTADYTASWGEQVLCDPSGAGFTITLPSAAGFSAAEILIKNVTSSTNTITIDGDGSETIDGSANVTITTARGKKRIASDGTNCIEV